MKRNELLDLYKKKLQVKNYSYRTERSYLSYLKVYLDYIILPENQGKKDESLIQDFLNYCKVEKEYSYSSMKQILASIRFLYLETLNKKVDFDFFFKVKKPDILPDVFSPIEISKIIAALKNLKHRTIISTIYSCGLRLSEVINLKTEDIDSENMMIKIRNAKGQNDRYVMLSEKLLLILREYCLEYNPKEYLFEGINNTHYSAKSVQQIFKKSIEISGIKKRATVHTLRHSFASHLLDNGTDIRYIQELLGHKNLATTQIYTYINPPSIKKIKSPFDAL